MNLDHAHSILRAVLHKCHLGNSVSLNAIHLFAANINSPTKVTRLFNATRASVIDTFAFVAHGWSHG